MTRRCRGDDGAGSVLVLAVASIVLLLGAVQVSVGAVAVARHRAAGVADLAALAAAEQARSGAGAACAAAGRTAAAGGADVESCVVRGSEVQVVVRVRPGGPLGELGVARGRARAGPGRGHDP